MQQERLNRVRETMEKQGIAQLILTQEQHIFYFTGSWVHPLDRLDALVVGMDSCRMLCYNLAVLETAGCETIVYSDTGKTVNVLSSLLADLPTGVDAQMQSRFLLPLIQKRPGIRWRVADCAEEARMLKDADEIRCLRYASELTDRVFASAFDRMQEGMTELEVGSVFSECFWQEGSGHFPGNPMVAFGEGTANPHHEPGNRRLKRGDTVFVDTGMRIHDYYSDMTRTVFFGDCTKEQRQVYEAVRRANEAGIAAVRPGARLSDVRRAALAELDRAGYAGACPHRISHGIGIDCHEAPFDTDENEVILKPGMCFSVEPGIYLAGRFGIRIEDLVTVTEDGCSLLSHAPKELRILS